MGCTAPPPPPPCIHPYMLGTVVLISVFATFKLLLQAQYSTTHRNVPTQPRETYSHLHTLEAGKKENKFYLHLHHQKGGGKGGASAQRPQHSPILSAPPAGEDYSTLGKKGGKSVARENLGSPVPHMHHQERSMVYQGITRKEAVRV